MFQYQDFQTFGVNLNNMCNFHPLEVVGHGSEIQFQVGENINYITFFI